MTDDHGPDCACNDCNWARAATPDDTIMGVKVVGGLGLLLLIATLVLSAFGVGDASGAGTGQASLCNPAIPDPPLTIELPDGTVVGATHVDYHPDARRFVVRYDWVFCDGFED